MATAKYGFFFFLLSKLLAIKGFQNESQDSVQFSGSNGIPNAWTQSPTSQGMQNDMNSYLNYPAGSNFNTMYDSQSLLNYSPQSTPTYYTPTQESLEDSTYGAYENQYYQPSSIEYSNTDQPMDYDDYLSTDPIINSQPLALQSSTKVSEPYYPPTQSRSEYAFPVSPMAVIQDQFSNVQSTFTGDLNPNYRNDNQNNPTQASSTTPQTLQSLPNTSPMQAIQDQLTKDPYQSIYKGESNLNNGYSNPNNPTQASSTAPQTLQSLPNTSPMQAIQDQLIKDPYQSTYKGESNLNNGYSNPNNPTQASSTAPQTLQSLPNTSPMQAIQDQLIKDPYQSTYKGESNLNNGYSNPNNPTQASSTAPQTLQSLPNTSPMQAIQDQLTKDPYQSTYKGESNLNNEYSNPNNPTQASSTAPQTLQSLPNTSPMQAIQDQLTKDPYQSTYKGESNLNNGYSNPNNPTQASSTAPQTLQSLPNTSPMQAIQDQLTKDPYQSTYKGESNLNNGYSNPNNPTQASSTAPQTLQSLPNTSPMQAIQDQLTKDPYQSTYKGESNLNNGYSNPNNPTQASLMTNSQPSQSSMTPMEAINDQLAKSPQSLQPQVQKNPELKLLDQMLANNNNVGKKPDPLPSVTPFFTLPPSNPFSQINSPQDSTDLSNKPSISLPQSSFITNQNLMPSYNDYLTDNFFKAESQGDSMNDPSLNPLPDSGNSKSGLEMHLDSFFSPPPLTSSTGLSNKDGTSNKANNKLENVEFDEPGTLNELAKYDKSFKVDIENINSGKGDHSEILTYANPNDIHLSKLPPIQSAGTIETKVPNNIDLLNTSPTSNPLPNNNAAPNSNQLLSSLFNYNQNKILSNQMKPAILNNNYNNSFDSIVDPKKMTSKNDNPLSSSADKNGYFYKQIDLTDSPQYTSSWSLLKPNYSLDNNSVNGNQPVNIPEMSLQYSSQYYNQDVPIPLLNNMSAHNTMFTVSNGIYVPSGATKVIFDVTRANFPRIPVIQQIQLTYVITKAIILGLQAISNRKSNALFSDQQVVKQNFNSFTPAASTLLPKIAIERDCNFPVSGTLLKKDFQLNITPITKNTDNNRPLTTDSIQQWMKNSGINLNKKLLDNKDYSQQTKNTQASYYTDLLATEIKNAIWYSNLMDVYPRDSPEVNEYIRQMILAVGIVYQDQINDVLQGSSPTMNIY